MKNIIILFLIVCSGFSTSASSYSGIISEGNKAYSEGKYNAAIELYQQVVSKGFESSELYYNLGNAFFKSKNYASALLYLEKARKLDPSDDKIDFNIQVCNTKIMDKIEELPQPFYKRWIVQFRQWFSMDIWATMSVVFLFLFFIFIAIYLMANTIRIRKITFWAGLIFVCISIVAGINAYNQYSNIHLAREAIIFEPTVNVKSSPDAGSQDIFVIHEGTKVSITDKVGIWIEVRIANGSDGWIQETAAEVI